MRLRVVVAAAITVVLGIAAASASATSSRHQASGITVWLQVDAQSGWPDVVAAATQQFQKDHPGVNVNVQYQSWTDHLQKFDATYRTDLFKAAGIAKAPASIAQYTADAQKLLAKNRGKGFSPVYIAGEDWYVAMSFVYDYGGSIAKTYKGKWIGSLDTPQSLAGLAAFKNFFLATSRASKSTIETRPNPYDVYAQGGAASMVGPSWFSCCVGAKYKTTTAQFVMPGHIKGQAMPGFLGGSDLAVPISSGNKDLAADWI